VLGLNSGGDSYGDLQSFLAATQIGFPLLRDASAAYSAYRQSGAVSPYPLDYVIDRGGRVAYFATEYNPDVITAVIDSLLQDTTAVDARPFDLLGLSQLSHGGFGGASLRLDLPASGSVELDLFDTRGRRVRRLLAGEALDEGVHVRPWDGRDENGRRSPAGVYLARLRVGRDIATAKLTLVR
jgi:hypothetical protein